MEPVDEKMAKDLKGKSRDAFDAQAATYDADMYGSHARSLYPHVIDEVKRAVEGIDTPRLLDLGCGTGALAEALLSRMRRSFAEDAGAGEGEARWKGGCLFGRCRGAALFG